MSSFGNLYSFVNSLYLLDGCDHMALGSAGELHDQLQRRGKLPLEDARFYAAEIVLILEYLQGQKVSPHDC